MSRKKNTRGTPAPLCKKNFPKLFNIKEGFIVIGRQGCPYYERSKEVLGELNMKMTTYDLKTNAEYKNLENCIKKLRTYKEIKNKTVRSSKFTTPKIFLGQLYIGGSDDLMEYLRDLIIKCQE